MPAPRGKSRWTTALCLCAVLAGFAEWVQADFEIVGQWPGYRRGVPNAVAVQDGYAYCTGPGFQVVDVSKPDAPNRVGGLDLVGEGYGLALRGRYAYVANGGSGLSILELTEPTVPRLVGQYTDVYANAVAVAGDHAYVADEYRALKVLDISNPASPRLVGRLQTPQPAVGVTVAGDYAYLAVFQRAVQIVDIADPKDPKLVSSKAVSGEPWRIAIAGDYAYVTGFATGLQILDISNPTAPRLVGGEAFSGWSRGVVVQSNLACVVTYPWDSGENVRLYDVTDPARPRRLGGHKSLGAAIGLAVNGDFALVAGMAGLDVLDISDPARVRPAGNCDLSGQTSAVAAQGSYAYLADGTAGLQVLDISEAANPKRIGRFATAGGALDVAVTNGLVCVAASEAGLQLIDVANPRAPQLAGSLGLPSGGASAVALMGNYACVLDGNLEVVDIGNPAKPRLVSTYAVSGYASSLVVQGQRAFLGRSDQGWEAVDLSDPANPVRVTIQTNAATSLAVSGNRLATADFSGVQFWDVTDLGHPIRAGRHEGVSGRLLMDGPYAFMLESSEYWQDILLLDLSDLSWPAPVTRFGGVRDWTRPRTVHLTVQDGWLLGAQSEYGLHIRRLPEPLTVVSPVTGQRVLAGEPAALTMAVYGRSGVDYTWYAGTSGDESSPVPAAKGPVLQLPGVWEPANYWVRMTNEAGRLDSGSLVVRPVSAIGFNPSGSWPAPPNDTVEDVVTMSNRVCVAGFSGGVAALQVLDASSPGEVKLLGQLPLPGPVLQMVAANGYVLAIAANSGLLVLDIREPAQPKEAGRYPDDGAGFGRMAVSGVRAFVMSSQAVLLLDLSDPANPKRLGSLAQTFEDIAALGPVLLGVAGGKLRIFDFSNSTNPVELGSYPDCSESGECLNANRVLVQGDRALVTLSDFWRSRVSRLEIVDFTIPTHPLRLGALQIQGELRAASGAYAVLLGESNRLDLVDIRDPQSPVLVGTFLPPFLFERFGITDEDLWIAGFERGLLGYDFAPQLKVGISSLDAEMLTLRWTGGAGVLLQESPELDSPDWQDVAGTEGVSQVRRPRGPGAAFYRATQR